MSKMIEKVARAICRAGITGPKSHLDEQEEAHWRRFEIEARAAIEAMRETPEIAYDNYRCDKIWRELNSREVLNLWIDAALAD